MAVRNQTFYHEQKVFNSDVEDCVFYGGSIAIAPSYVARRCEFYKPQALAGSVQDCLVQFEDDQEPRTHYTANVSYAGTGGVCLNQCQNVVIKRSGVPTVRTQASSVRTTPVFTSYSDGTTTVQASRTGIAISGNHAIIHGHHFRF